MTEYEIIDLLQQRYSELGSLSTQYFTLVSAYVVTAFLVGSKLSKLQLSIVSSLYVIWSASNSAAVWNAINTSNHYLTTLSEMGSTFPDSTSVPVTTGYLVLVQGGSLMGSLYFMWSTRRKAINVKASTRT